MNAVKGVFRELVARRLWPVAVVLLLLALAMPVLLSKDAEEPSTPTTPAANAGAGTGAAGSSADPLAGDGLIAASDDPQLDRRVLGRRKDPFRPSGDQPKAPDEAGVGSGSEATPDETSDLAPLPGLGSSSSGSSGSGSSSSGSTGSGSSGTGSTGSGSTGSTGSGSTGTSGSGSTGTGSTGSTGSDGSSGGSSDGSPDPSAAATPTPTPKPSYELNSLIVSIDEGKRESLKRLQPLPSAKKPSIIYLGLLEDEKTAVFLVDRDVVADGDGSCHPSPEDCQTLHLRKGETEFFDVPAAAPTEPATGEAKPPAPTRFQLDLLDIKTKKTASASTARRAYALTSKSGRRALRTRMSRLGRIRYDRRQGNLVKLSAKAYRSSMARASKRSAARDARAARRQGARRGALQARASRTRAGLGTP